jgi:hypothetical protein
MPAFLQRMAGAQAAPTGVPAAAPVATPQAAPVATPQAAPAAPLAQPPGTYGPLGGSMPALIQQYQPGSTNSLMSLWQNELGSGAIQLPSVPNVM